MTSSRRHFVFWPSEIVINDIFNTKHHKSLKLGTYKLHVIIYQMMPHDLTCASWRAHMRASKFQNSQNPLLTCNEYVSDHFEHFKIFRAYASARTSYARTARTDTRNLFFSSVLNSLLHTFIFPSVFNHSGQRTKTYARVKHKNPRVRLWPHIVKMGQNDGYFKSFITP